MSAQTTFQRQDSTAERLKTFKMRKSTPTEAVTNGFDGQQLNFYTVKTTSQNSNGISSIPSGPPSAPPSRPNSHHRRRSSVSTRRESAEMMGVSAAALADLPSSEDGDTNSIRNRALRALEGKRDDRPPPVNYLSGYSKVEIPELPTSNVEASDFDRKVQPILSLSGAMNKRDSLGRERDSYGRVISQALSIKDQLHTLLEEDEEEECSPQKDGSMKHSPATSSTTSESFPTSFSAPTMSRSNRLKPLRLSTSSPLVFQSTIVPPKPTGPSLSEIAANRRRSLSYRRSDDVNSSVSASSTPGFAVQFIRNPLPTPESTPTTSERPLSPTEQAFLYNNQASLLARISELERVLASRSRPMSFVSASSRHLSTSSIASEAQSEEMLRLVQDLKTERDELSRDLGVSQSKVENLEKQITVLNRRVENERKEAWVAKQSEQALKVENSNLAKELDAANLHVRRLQEDLTRVQEELQERDAFHTHRKDVSMPRSVERNPNFEDEDEDELAHYEDEDVGDVSFYSDLDDTTTSSLSPLRDQQGNSTLTPTSLFGHQTPSLSSAASISPPATPFIAPVVPHKKSSSLEQGWSFPKGVKPTRPEPSQVDRFFNCLEVMDNEDLTQTPFPTRSANTQDKYGFFSPEDDEDDEEEDFPFMLPSQSGPEPIANRLSVPSADHFQLTPPLSPSSPFTPHSSRPSQSGRQTSPSLIPKLSPPSFQIATPTSVPRLKISPVTPPSTKTREQRELTAKSPTKLPQPRSAGNYVQSASSPSAGFQILKGSGLSALANYLPWNTWSAEDGTTKSTKEGSVPSQSTTISTPGPRPRIHPNYSPLKRDQGTKTKQIKPRNADQLVLL